MSRRVVRKTSPYGFQGHVSGWKAQPAFHLLGVLSIELNQGVDILKMTPSAPPIPLALMIRNFKVSEGRLLPIPLQPKLMGYVGVILWG
jgi:hypothetical protein